MSDNGGRGRSAVGLFILPTPHTPHPTPHTPHPTPHTLPPGETFSANPK
ncbi:MAG: hypothetical protein LW716_11645 [Microcystis sp. 53602_E8]|nr:hypothetical protein [Microcystis sp. 53602_E8]